jgi:Rod binding domain-containing protein
MRINGTGPAAPENVDARLKDLLPGKGGAKEAAVAVEGIFMSMLVGEMKKTLPGGGFFGDAPGSDVFDGMFERLMGEEMAKKGGFGLAAFVEEGLKARSETHQEKTPKADLERTGAVPRQAS